MKTYPAMTARFEDSEYRKRMRRLNKAEDRQQPEGKAAKDEEDDPFQPTWCPWASSSGQNQPETRDPKRENQPEA